MRSIHSLLTPARVARAKTHDFRPANVAGVAINLEAAQEARPALILQKARPKIKVRKVKLNLGKLTADIHAALKDNVRGYAFGLRQNGQHVATLTWDSARVNGSGWTLDTKMHVASVSKTITAMAAVKMLTDKGLPFTTKIGPYFPVYWNEGQNSPDITFRELLTHHGGFTDANYDGSYPVFKQQIEQGVAANRASQGGNYTNAAFSIVRVLNSTMTGAVPKDLSMPSGTSATERDAIWDDLTSESFELYVKSKILTPSGVSNVATTPSTGSAFAYTTRPDQAGWDSGELQTQLGGAGFRVSVNDLLNIMGTFRRKGSIVSPQKAQEALDAELGVDTIDTPLGKMYGKGGWWGGGGMTGGLFHVEQSYIAFLPDDMELAILVNSNIGSSAASLYWTVNNAVINNME